MYVCEVKTFILAACDIYFQLICIDQSANPVPE